ncbi:MAG: hypothetical protein AAF599_00030 [Bacteroidota bacterium]
MHNYSNQGGQNVNGMRTFSLSDAIAYVSHFQSWTVKTPEGHKIAEAKTKGQNEEGQNFAEVLSKLQPEYFPFVLVRFSMKASDTSGTAIVVKLANTEDAQIFAYLNQQPQQQQPQAQSNEQLLAGLKVQADNTLKEFELKLRGYEAEAKLKHQEQEIKLKQQKIDNEHEFRLQRFKAKQEEQRDKIKLRNSALSIGGALLGGVLEKWVPGASNALSGFLDGDDDIEDFEDYEEETPSESKPKPKEPPTDKPKGSFSMK